MKFFDRKWKFFPMLEEDGAGGSGGTNSSEGEAEKTFTQAELNRIAAQEKRQGAASVLKALGFEKEDDAKAFVEQYRKAEASKKDDLQKAQDKLANETKAKAEVEKKADLLEKKLKVLEKGVPAASADDVVLLATAKAVDGVSFDDALETVKTTYPALFGEHQEAGGTGGSGNPPRGGAGGDASSIGKRLAEKRNTSKARNDKHSYFNS